MTPVTASQAVIIRPSYNVAGEMTSMSGQYSESRGLTSLQAPGVNMQDAYAAGQNNGQSASQTDVLTGETVQYTHGFGNLTNQNVATRSAPTWSAAYDWQTNRIIGECADANGNIRSGCGKVYDAENRLKSVTGGSYSYAPGNKRIWKSSSAGEEITFYGIGGQKLATYSVVFNSVPLSTTLTLTQTGTWWYFGGKLIKNAAGIVGQDRLGSVGKFYPYGQEKPSATTNNKEKFATYHRDEESGLDYAQNRYHAPGQGRFLTADPYQASAGAEDPGSWNRYAYTRGDPSNRADPSGLDDCPVQHCTTMNVVGYAPESHWVPYQWSPYGGSEEAWMYCSAPGTNCGDYTQAGSIQPGTAFDMAAVSLKSAGQALRGRTQFSTGCSNGLSGLGVTPQELAEAAWSFNVVDGIGSNLNIGDAYGPAGLGQAAQSQYDRDYAAWLAANNQAHYTVGDFFQHNTGVTAFSPFGGATIYINSGTLDTSSASRNQALLMHELAHMKFGLDDGAMLDHLFGAGSRNTRPSADITKWLLDNCI